jgi:hypothetical protein
LIRMFRFEKDRVVTTMYICTSLMLLHSLQVFFSLPISSVFSCLIHTCFMYHMFQRFILFFNDAANALHYKKSISVHRGCTSWMSDRRSALHLRIPSKESFIQYVVKTVLCVKRIFLACISMSSRGARYIHKSKIYSRLRCGTSRTHQAERTIRPHCCCRVL